VQSEYDFGAAAVLLVAAVVLVAASRSYFARKNIQ
jgi:hypothetical protein